MIYFTTNIGGDHAPPCFFRFPLNGGYSPAFTADFISYKEVYTRHFEMATVSNIFIEFLLCLTPSCYIMKSVIILRDLCKQIECFKIIPFLCQCLIIVIIHINRIHLINLNIPQLLPDLIERTYMIWMRMGQNSGIYMVFFFFQYLPHIFFQRTPWSTFITHNATSKCSKFLSPPKRSVIKIYLLLL